MLESILNFLFPNNCLVCGKNGHIVCQICFSKIPTTPVDKLNTLSVYEYRNSIVNKLLWKLKYKHCADAAKAFGKPVSEELIKWLGETKDKKVIFIPIPLSDGDGRLSNHAATLAKEISKNTSNSFVYENILFKNSKKKQAHTKSKHERLHNVENIFYIKNNLNEIEKDLLKNNLLILVDDVTTTGSTIWNAKLVLANYLDIEMERILAITVAH